MADRANVNWNNKPPVQEKKGESEEELNDGTTKANIGEFQEIVGMIAVQHVSLHVQRIFICATRQHGIKASETDKTT
jgi:hypothetical protein